MTPGDRLLCEVCDKGGAQEYEDDNKTYTLCSFHASEIIFNQIRAPYRSPHYGL